MKMQKNITDSLDLIKKILAKNYLLTIQLIGNKLIKTLKKRKKILIAGNGGSASQAHHFASEIVNKYIEEREGLPAIALTGDSSILTSIANDTGFENIFSRQIEALGEKRDVFIAISTSGNSRNIIKAAQIAKKKRLYVIGILGNQGGKINNLCDLSLIIPSKDIPRIQEVHLLVIHILCGLLDDYFGKHA